MEKTKAAFRSAMGGYNKQDVNSYIQSLSETFNSEKQEYESRLSELETELERLRARETNDCKAELERANSVISAQNEKLDAQTSQLAELQSKLNGKAGELALAEEKLSLLAEAEEKLQKYDQMSAKLGELMIEAASSADRIKNEAKLAADETLRSSEERERRLRERETELSGSLEKRYSEAVVAINVKLNELAESGMASLKASLAAAESELATVIERQRSAAKATVLQTAAKLPELQKLARITSDAPADELPQIK